MPKSLLILSLRFIAFVSMSVWLGGFTFYGAFVIPILHNSMGGYESGMVTGQVTNPLNVVGVGTILGWWTMVVVERSTGGCAKWTRIGLLAGSTAILVGLIALHPVMDARLESGLTPGFYPLHQIYLNASTVQWVVNLGLIATSLLLWQAADCRAGMSDAQICTDSPSPCPAASITASE